MNFLIGSIHILCLPTECDNITPEQYKELSRAGSKVKYNCQFCRSSEDMKLVTS